VRARVWPIPWWVTVFVVALSARLGFLLLVDEPLLFSHPYNYFFGALKIIHHPQPWWYVLRSDEWHAWNGSWTMAPLYHLFLAGVFRIAGEHLRSIQVAQCLLDSATAVLVGAMARAMAGRQGAWAGIAHALYWPAVQMTSSTLTENLHTPLLVASLAVLVRSAHRRRSDASAAAGADYGAGVLGGALLGLSGLARAVSLGFLPLAALCHALPARGTRQRILAFLVVAGAGVAVILPWSVRNALVIGDPVLIETVGVWNLWTDNTFVSKERYDRQAWFIAQATSPAEGRALALAYAKRGIREHPDEFADKVRESFRHFFRPEGLHVLLEAEEPDPAWRLAVAVLLDDALLFGALVLFAAFLLGGGPPVPGRRLIGLWTLYYLLLVIVVFHNEIRYRSAFAPFVFAGAGGGWALWNEARGRRRWRVALAALCGAWLAVAMLRRYVEPGGRALWAWWTLRPAAAAIASSNLAEAERLSFLAAQRDWHAGRPWVRYGGWMARAGHPVEAVAAYRRALLRNPTLRVPPLVLPRLLREIGRADEADALFESGERLRRTLDPWLSLEIAWRELPPPRTDEVLLGHNDEGAVRGFLHARAGHRWSRHRAWIRLVPSIVGDARVVIEAGSPEPSVLPAPEVSVRINSGHPETIRLSREVRPYVVQTVLAAGAPLLIELRSPTWNAVEESADQGIRVDRVAVMPGR
jgi:Dolichyl-phosphate-mannose-protein mannosyltransferase